MTPRLDSSTTITHEKGSVMTPNNNNSNSNSDSSYSDSSNSDSSVDEWHVWPGGQTDTDLNPKETFKNTDFGFTGPVTWDVTQGGTQPTVTMDVRTQSPRAERSNWICSQARSNLKLRWTFLSILSTSLPAWWRR